MSIITCKVICLKFIDELYLDKESIEICNELIKINQHLHNVGLNLIKESILVH